MTERIGKTLVIAAEKPQQCDYCGKIEELRLYGRNGACICFDCAMLSDNKETTEKMFERLISGSAASDGEEQKEQIL